MGRNCSTIGEETGRNEMNSDAKISVIIPVYNTELYIERAVRSIIGQTFKNIEVIIVDDRGTDRSIDIVRRFASQDNRIKIIKMSEHGGRSRARNIGIKKSSAPYIMFCDADDYYESSVCEKMLDGISQNNSDIAMCGVNVIYEADSSREFMKSDEEYFRIKKDGIAKINENIRANTDCSLWNKVFRRDIINKYNIWFPEGINFEDNFFKEAYFSVAKDIFFIKEKLYNYVRHDGDSVMGQLLARKKGVSKDYLHAYIGFNDFLKNNDLIARDRNYMAKMFFIYLDFALLYERTYSGRRSIYNLAHRFIRREKWKEVDFPLDLSWNFRMLATENHEVTRKKYIYGLLKLIKSPSGTKINLFGIPLWMSKIEEKYTIYLIFGIPVFTKR